jgi:metallophosphoesterase (TIGR00282 family)
MSDEYRVLLVGDVVGESGIAAVESLLPAVKAHYSARLAVVNGENAADGFGMTEEAARRILAAGADAITTGNHIWEKRDFLSYMDSETRILRPANYPAGVAGRGWTTIGENPARALIVNLQGRQFMPVIDCPFRTFDALHQERPQDAFIVDFHAESTREKEALAYHIDGRAAVIVGTHTHVQTADQRILPAGTAYISDLGMCGALDSIIGMDKTVCLNRIKTQIAYKMESAKGPGFIQGVAVAIHAPSRKALSIERWTRTLTP